MEKFKKIDKEFLITDSSLNSYSYRLLTSGYLLAEFQKNPIGYWMHGTTKEYPREQGVLVRWEDFRLAGDKVYAKPCINLSHPRGQRTADEIEAGFLNAASVGHLVALEVSSNPTDYLPEQEGVTLSKWFNRECSLCDIPGNYNALTDLVDAQQNPLNLSDFKPQIKNMKQIFLNPAQLAKIPNLKADPEAGDVETAINNLVAKAAQVDTLTSDLAAANARVTVAETALTEAKKAAATKEVNDLVATAVSERRCTKEHGEKLKTLFIDKPAELRDLIATMQPYSPVTKELNAGAVTDLAAMSWDELDASGKLEDLKAKDFEGFKKKFSESHGGAEYKGK